MNVHELNLQRPAALTLFAAILAACYLSRSLYWRSPSRQPGRGLQFVPVGSTTRPATWSDA